MVEKIEIIQENYEKILEVARISNSKSDLCKKLGWNSGYKREELNILLLNNNFDFNIFPKESYNISPFNNEKKLKEAVKNSFNYTEVIKFFFTKIGAGHHITVKKYIKKFSISTEHFIYSKGLEPQFINNENIFIINSKVSPSTVRKRVIKDELIPYKCKCGNEGCWQGQKMTLQLDHLNGDRTDNRLENLRFLCPNCHALTPTYGSKNKKSKKLEVSKIEDNEKVTKIKIKKIENNKEQIIKNIDKFNSYNDIMTEYKLVKNSQTNHELKNLLVKSKIKAVEEFLMRVDKKVVYPELEELIESIKEKGFVQVGKELGCSDNAVRKYLIKNGIDVKSIKKVVVLNSSQ